MCVLNTNKRIFIENCYYTWEIIAKTIAALVELDASAMTSLQRLLEGVKNWQKRGEKERERTARSYVSCSSSSRE